QDEARRRLLRVGEKRVGDHRERPLWRLALDQFKSLVVLLLLAASVIAWLLEERVEAVAILAALLLNAAIGFGSEWRARVSLARLRALGVPQALCRRGGALRRLAAAELIPGDLIVLEAGAQVPADAWLLRSAALRVAEAALTGESVPVDKDAEARLPADTPLADRITMVYLGTAVVAGSGVALVTATGLATELGRIGRLSWRLAGLQWLTVSWGPLQALLGTVPLSGGDWLAVVCAVLWPVLGSPRPTSEAVTRDSGYEMP
ncbi:MAG: cation-transporting P-type ATPase, partial [candidate division NC10 bacterium]